MLAKLWNELTRAVTARQTRRARSGTGFASANETPREPLPKTRATYSPDIFDVGDIDAAMRIILTAEAGTSTQERWQRETPYLADEIGRALALSEHSCVLDYGCGIGRVAKALIERHGCSVVGVDLSAGMRALAPRYVSSDRFTTCAPDMLEQLVERGFRATHAYACWVIQHCAAPDQDLARIERALAQGSSFFVLNSNDRWVPTDVGWVNDGISVAQLLANRFHVVERKDLPAAITTPELARSSFMMTLRKRETAR